MTKTTVDEYVTSLPDTFRPVAESLRAILDAALGSAESRIWHGHPVWLVDKKPIAGFKAYTSYVTFMIWDGHRVSDPTGRLRPGARDMVSVKVTDPSEVDEAEFASWLKQAEAT